MAGRPFAHLANNVQTYFGSVISQYADEMVLLHSPLTRIATFVGSGAEVDDLREYARVLKNPRNIRVFACRTTGAFNEVIDPDSRRKALAMLEEYRYFNYDRFEGMLMQAAGRPTRVFDEGNKKVTDMIRGLRQSVHNRLETTEYLLVPEGAGLVAEADSSTTHQVGASDLAAGYARDLYESSDGRKKVVDAFDRVILNGDVLRN